jgi:hypothetical protein
MKEKRISLFIIILLLFSVAWLSVNHIRLSNEYSLQQNNANVALKSSLSFAMSSFALDYDNSGESDKQYSYNEAMTNLASSSQLVKLTTYVDKNNYLDAALYNLYKLMEQNEYKRNIMDKSKPIYDSLLRLSQNPADKEATDNIIKLTEEIRQEKNN